MVYPELYPELFIVSSILGFGSAAEVPHPDSLRNRIAEEPEAVFRPYRDHSRAESEIVPKKNELE